MQVSSKERIGENIASTHVPWYCQPLFCSCCGSGLADYTWASQLTLMLTLRKLLLVFRFGSMCLSISTQNFCIMDEHNNNAKKIFFFFQLLASSYGDAHAVWNVRTKRERLKKNTTRKGGGVVCLGCIRDA